LQERITTLQSEVARLKGRLAAEAGDEDLLSFILRPEGKDESVSYVDDLKRRLKYVNTFQACDCFAKLGPETEKLKQRSTPMKAHCKGTAENSPT